MRINLERIVKFGDGFSLFNVNHLQWYLSMLLPFLQAMFQVQYLVSQLVVLLKVWLYIQRQPNSAKFYVGIDHGLLARQIIPMFPEILES